MANKLTLKLNKNTFPDFISKLHNVSNIDPIVKLKIDKNKILLYSMEANDSAVLALKSYIFNTAEYIENFDENELYNFIIINTPKFIKGLEFLDVSNTIKLDLSYKPLDDAMQVRSAQFSTGKLKIQTVGGEDSKIIDINSEQLEQRLDIDTCKFKFNMTKQDFTDMKKLCSIETGKNFEIFSITFEKGKILAGEYGKWELLLGEIDDKIDTKITFKKKHLSNINIDNDIINFYMFENFLLVKDNNSNLMLSHEQNFEE